MNLNDLLKATRSYRSFDETHPVSREELTKIVAATRLTPSGGNKQPLKYYLSADAKTNAVIQPLTAWGALIRDQYQLPPQGHKPAAFIVICVDTNISPNPAAADKDVGIAAQTMLIKATEMGLGGLMIGAFQPQVKEALNLAPNLHVSLILAIGKPDETIVLEDAEESVKYYRDANGVHHVPKRTLKELIIND